LSSALADHVGLVGSFYAFAALNLAGAALAYRQLGNRGDPAPRNRPAIAMTALGSRTLQAAFGIGFCILFAFIGTFTFVNFVLTRPPLSLNGMQLGLVYFVFLPSIFTTPLAGIASRHCDTRTIVWLGLGIAAAGAPLLVTDGLVAVLAGMILMGIGTFVAQAAATSFVNRAARGDRTAASGVYLCFYYLGGLAGSAVLGQVFDRSGWVACVGGVVAALLLAALLTPALRFDDR
jgi:predicted MFS family arabinose efflux permease